MLPNIALPRAVFTALGLLGLRTLSSEHVSHLVMRQRPAGPASLLPEVLARHGDLSNFTSLLNKYPDILAHAGAHGITLLAPIDSAFQKVTDLDFDNEAQVVPLLQYHILQDTILTDDLEIVHPYFPPTMLSNQAWTNITGGQRVTLMRQDEDVIFLASGLDSRSMLDYQNRDIHFFEGVIQPVDTLLVPPLQLAVTTRTRFPSMSSFLGALYKTGLAIELMEAKNVTIFAPDNQAFQKIFGALAELSTAELRNVLEYHIVPNTVLYSNELQDQRQFPTRATTTDNNKTDPISITITTAGNYRYIDSSLLRDPDVMIANSVVHIISDVLNPRKPNVKADPARKTQSAVFELKGNTTAGPTIPTPYLSDLPCITDCEPTDMPAEPKTTARRPKMGAAAPKCTVMPGAMGVVGMSVLVGFL